MYKRTRVPLILAVVSLVTIGVSAQRSRDKIEIVKPKDYSAPVMERSAKLQAILSSAVSDVMTAHKIMPEEIGATLIDLRDPNRLQTAEVNGEKRLYTASVVKMFYMAALERQLEDGKVVMTKELERGLHDMIVDSSNEATQYILDVLTDTSSGGELPPKEFEKWQYKRNRVNRFFASLGYQNINVNQKTFCEDAYGIEQQSRAYKGQNRNMLTTNATARLLAEIALRRFVNEKRSEAMLSLMSRDWSKPSNDPDNQAVGFTGKALIDNNITGAKLWSKAGWTSKSRHDAAYVETPDGLKFVIVVFTENHANERDPIPSIATKVLNGLLGK
ncbi:MAG: serine hydrolase [Pyrinomonadaceae bacterium]|nr:serine hydrolase [Blastocatellia bacterium]MCW5955697.1 serine hydrolase [Pyrinomonadaceae bacterium]